MKRYIKCDRRFSSKKENVRKVVEYMGWNTPTFCDPGANGYKCKWGGKSIVSRYGEEQVRKWIDEIKEGTGIECILTRSGNIVIPYAN